MKKNNQRNKLKKEQQQLGKNNKKDWQKKHMKNKKNKIDQLENKLKILNLKYNKLVKNKHDPKF